MTSLGPVLFGVAVVAAGACSSGDGGGDGAGDNTGGAAGVGGTGASGAGADGSGGRIDVDPNDGCAEQCDDGVCIDGVCCPAELACGGACCAEGQACSFLQCVVPGERCLDSDECPADWYCDYALGDDSAPSAGGSATAGAAGAAGSEPGSCRGGATPPRGRCLPRPPACEPGVEPTAGDAISCLPECEYRPGQGSFSPSLKYEWRGGNVTMTPVVIQLDDDDCDQNVDERDLPEIVFTSFEGSRYEDDGTLWAISMVDGHVVEKWSVKPEEDAIHPGRPIAAGNIDGQPGNEIVVCTAGGKVRAFAANGDELWIDEVGGGCLMPNIGDLDGDGRPEVVVESRVLDGATGEVKASLNPANTSNVVLSDMDGDGRLDIVSPSRVYRGDGSLLADTGLPGTYVAVGDFDEDGVPEAASIDRATHSLNVWHYSADAEGQFEVLRTGVDIHGTFENICPSGTSGARGGGGPPTIADFNGDGTPDVAVASGIGYAVIDGTKVLDASVPADETNLWLSRTQDCSSAATGSSVFDFEGDGRAEVLYSDEQFLRVYNGEDGEVLFETCNTTGTLLEYPLVADVDNDGHADIVVVSNDYSAITCPTDGSKQRGVRVFGETAGSWVRTRRVWNQHAYHVTNVEEDGTIPANEVPNWTVPRLNNFRQNAQPLGEFSAPDLVVTVSPQCTDYGLVARVRNIGSASVPPGVAIGFYAGEPADGGVLLGSASTRSALYPAESEAVTLLLDSPPPGVISGSTPVFAVVDDGGEAHAWQECRTDNNTSEQGTGRCERPR